MHGVKFELIEMPSDASYKVVGVYVESARAPLTTCPSDDFGLKKHIDVILANHLNVCVPHQAGR